MDNVIRNNYIKAKIDNKVANADSVNKETN